MADKSELMAELLQQSKYALLDLKCVLSDYDVGGDRDHPAWETVKDLDAVVKQLDPEWKSVVDWDDEDEDEDEEIEQADSWDDDDLDQ